MEKWGKRFVLGSLAALFLTITPGFCRPVYAAVELQNENAQAGIGAEDRLTEYDGEKYYVDENGERVVNQWVSFQNNGQCDEDVNRIYYYFGSNGKACRDVKKKIDGKIYFFDEEGHMRSGWYSREAAGGTESYYLGNEDEGWVYTGWHRLPPAGDEFEEIVERKWFYFNLSNGKAYRGKRYINGSYYRFDEETAAMLDGWVEGTPGSADESGEDATPSTAWYETETGRLGKGWVYTYDAVDTDGERYWFYLDKDGAAFNDGGRASRSREPVNPDNPESLYTYMGTGLGGEDGTTFYSNLAAKVIDGKTYLFDENGHMMTGNFYLWVVRREGSSIPLGSRSWSEGRYTYGGAYYFNEESGSPKEGQMMTGRLKMKETGDYYHFRNSGMAYERAIVNGYLYMESGICETARNGNKYELVYIDGGDDPDYPLPPITEKGSGRSHINCWMIVDASGRVKKNGTVSIDGFRYTVKDYEVTEEPFPSDQAEK